MTESDKLRSKKAHTTALRPSRPFPPGGGGELCYSRALLQVPTEEHGLSPVVAKVVALLLDVAAFLVCAVVGHARLKILRGAAGSREGGGSS